MLDDVHTSGIQVHNLHLSHDPWVKGEDFESWLRVFRDKGQSGVLILNTKEDGLESWLEVPA